MRRKALLPIVLSAAMILGVSSSVYAAGEEPSNAVTAGIEASVTESQDEVETEQPSLDDSSFNSGQEPAADTQDTAKEIITETESESEEEDIKEEPLDEDGKDATLKASADESKTESDEEEKPETLVGAEGERVSVGENVTAEFDSETGILTFYSQGGTLSRDWKSMLNVTWSSVLGEYAIDDHAIKEITISDNSDMMYFPVSCYQLFQGLVSLESLDLTKVDTSNVSEMGSMFSGCSNLQTLDVSGFDTSNVRCMGWMFSGCSNLQTLDVSRFNTSKVLSMEGMFCDCSSLKELDLSGFNTSSVHWVEGMFLTDKYVSNMLNNCEFVTILTPVNMHFNIELPDIYVDSFGNEYTYLPRNYSESIRLTKKGIESPVALEILSLSDDYYGKTGTQASFYIEAEGSGTISYQWQYRTAGMTNWRTPSQASAKTADYIFNLRTSYDNIEVRCIVSDESGNEIISDTRKANVFEYTLQPEDVTASLGQTVDFTVSAIGRGVTYQWYYKRPDSSWKKAVVSGSNTSVLPITAGTKNDGTSYRCVITDEVGNKITSAAGTLTLETPLQITGISEDTYDVNGENVTFHIDAVGNGNLSYQWQYKLAGETKWRTPGLASAKTADYVFKLRPSYDNIEVRCIVKDTSGNSITSDVRKANVFAITSQPQDAELALGEKTTFAVEAVGREMTYQWYYMRPEGSWKKVIVAGYNTASLAITANNKNDGTMFRCLVKDVLGNTLTSRAAMLTQ